MWALKSPTRKVWASYVVTRLVEEIKRVSMGRFKVGTMFRGEVYGEDIEIFALSYGGALNFYGEATRI